MLAPATGPILRVEAARSLGLVRTRGAEADAKRLLAEAGPTAPAARLAAASVLRYHRGEAAMTLLKQLARDAEPAVALAALEALYEADPCLVAALARPAAASKDARTRTLAVAAVRKCPAVEYVPLLAGLMGDLHPHVRAEARKALRELARLPGYDDLVRRETVRQLATSDRRALEQAIILLAQLDHKAAGARFVELLRFDRPEVAVTAAWGLRKLAVPAHLPAIHSTVERQVAQYARARSAVLQRTIELQVAQLNQALGQARYRPAEPLLRKFVPRDGGVGEESRAAAVWALGYIHENAAPDDLVVELCERMNDLRSIVYPEDPRVGRTAAVALGRMKAKAAEDTLRSFCPGGVLSNDNVANASGWALQQLTGQPLKPGVPVPLAQRGWFLEPVD